MPATRLAALTAAGLLTATVLITVTAPRGLAGHAATATNLYVSPTGSDSDSGTSPDSPLKTLERAKDVVRGIDQSTSGEIRVNRAGGVYMSMLGDGGGIYTNGITGTSLSAGEHVTGNIVHDQKNATGGHALYTDNGASYVTISGNGEYNNTVGDWGSKHVNYTLNDGSYDPLDIEGNYWEKGTADDNQKSVVIKNNHTITSAGQIPSSIVAAAGLEPAYADILDWTPAA
jgi:hypothetical protein